MTGQFPLRSAAIAALVGLAVSGCAATPSPVIKTLDDQAYRGVAFHNILIIGAASDYDARALFERRLASAIGDSGSSATPYFAVAGRNPMITRNVITNAIRSRGFDALLLTRVKGQEGTTSTPNGIFNPFRLDYAALNDAMAVDVTGSVNLVTELWSAANQRRVWAIETVRTASSIERLIEIESAAIVRELRKDKKIG